jgi:hypothetical protein
MASAERCDIGGVDAVLAVEAPEHRPFLFTLTSAMKMKCGMWWIRPSHALVVWMLLSIALESEIFGSNDIWGADTIKNGTSSLNARAIRINMRNTVERYLAGVDRAPQRNRIRTADRPHRGVASASNDLYRSGGACHRGQRFRLLGPRPLVASMSCFRLTN